MRSTPEGLTWARCERHPAWFCRSCDRIAGAAAKEIVRSLLESCGYTVYPFGYESTFSVIRQKLFKQFEDSNLALRIRSMPDFLVVGGKELHLAEVKFRKGWGKHGIVRIPFRNVGIQRYQGFWPESVLVLVSPHGEHFYVQRVADIVLKGGPGKTTDLDYSDFRSLPHVFSRADGKDFEYFFAAVDTLSTMWG